MVLSRVLDTVLFPSRCWPPQTGATTRFVVPMASQESWVLSLACPFPNLTLLAIDHNITTELIFLSLNGAEFNSPPTPRLRCLRIISESSTDPHSVAVEHSTTAVHSLLANLHLERPELTDLVVSGRFATASDALGIIFGQHPQSSSQHQVLPGKLRSVILQMEPKRDTGWFVTNMANMYEYLDFIAAVRNLGVDGLQGDIAPQSQSQHPYYELLVKVWKEECLRSYH